MEAFCGSKFWNESYFIHTRHPDFTPCFEKTVLLWVPCLYLWLFFPLEAIFLTKSQDRHIPWSFFNISKIICSSLIFLVGCVHLISNIVISKSENVFAVDFYYPVIFIISVALQMVTLIMEKRRGIQSSAYLFMFWFLLSACGLITFRTSILHIQSGGDEAVSMEIVIFILYYILTLLMFGLNFFADRRPQYLEHPRSKKSCPEEDASFPSRITFSWFTGMVWFGYKQPITQDSLWDLSYRNSSKKITKDWEKHWNKSLQKTYNTVESQTTARYKNKSSNVEMIGSYAEKHHYISILPTMIKSFGVEMLVGAILKLVHDLLQFVSPVLIGLLINYTTDKRENKNNWLGFVYAFCFLVVTQTQSLFLGQYFIRMFNIGLKIRTSIVSAVYQKALRISNFSRKESTVGEIVNLMSVDAQRFMDLTTYVNMIWSAPLQITLCLYFLWQILGPSVLAGLAVMVLLIPVNGFLANKQKILQIQQMKLKDGRVKLINEILNGIKVLKLYAWEPSFEQQVLKVRKEEISVLKKAAYLNTATSFLWTCTPFIVTFFMFMMYVLISEDHKLEPDLVFVSITILNILRMPLTLLPMVIAAVIQVSLATFAVYVAVTGVALDSRTAFVSITLFNLLRFPLVMLPMMITSVVQAGVSLKRMNRFLNSDELDPNAVTHDKAESDPIRIENGTFAWDKGGSDILSQINLAVPEGSLVAVVGPVGAGKSSLCSAILGEMAKISGRVNVKGSTTFVPQQAWIQNATLEDNILFGKSKEPFFYRKVIDACALKADLDMLPAKEMTEIGEKGINLSGGQKQRVSLARAVYYNSDIYLLDDPLSAVDSHVGRHIFDKVIGPRGMLAGKTRIMVTHNLSYLPKVDHIVVLKNGQITEQGSYRYLMSQKGELQAFLLQYISEETEEEVEELKHELEKSMGREVVKRQISRISRESESSSCDEKMKSNSLPRTDSLRHRKGALGENDVTAHVPKVGEKLIEAEKAETGRVSFNVYKYYMKAVGYVTTILTVLFYALSQAASVGSNLWLSKWSEDDNSTDPAIRDRYLGIYGSLGLLQAISTVLGFGFIARATLVGSKKLHNRLLLSIMRCNSSFFDMTPTGRLVNRFAKDVDTLDILLPMNLRSIILCLLAVIATLAIITYTTPIFIVALLPVLVLYYFIQLMYVRSSRQLKRIESVTRSPIYSHFGETIQGAATIRAYGKEADFIEESQRKVDYNQVSYYPSIVANRWLAIRLELLGNFITFFAALFAVMSDTITGGDVGLSISYALSVTQTLNWLVRMTSDVETNIVAVERIKEYSETEQEAPWDIEEKRPPQEWPSKGVVRFDKFSTRYRQELDLVIKKIDFQIDSMEKVGIVGRTGAGKSSLTLSLFRIIEPAEGQIVIDGMDVAELGLHDLRRNLTIIPQDPVLFSGTLRMNLDPFESFSDRAIWDALEHAHLKEYVTNLPSKLQHDIAEGGENLSVGQRQLVCLARALLRKTKILVLDEATAAVDLETDTLIQETIRREFSDCTVITIAHRLNTIMDSDRVLVMEKGRIKEFDSPSKLLSDTQSSFYSMAKDAGLV